jgi:MFS family permease
MAVLAVRLFDESSAFLLPGTFESLRAEIDLSYSQASSAFVVIAIGAIAGSLTSVAADFRSRRVIASAGTFGYAASLVVIGSATSYGAVLVGSFVIGIASTAMVDASEIALADLAGDDLPRQLTRQNFLGSVGDVLGPALVIGVAAAGLSWRWCFWLGAALLVVYGLWLASVPFPAPHPSTDGTTVRGSIASVLRDPLVWIAGAAGMLLGPLDEPLLAFLIAHLENARGLTEAGATLIAGLTVVGEFVGYATLRRRAGNLTSDGALLAVSTTALVAAPEAITASVAAVLVGVFLIRVWLDLQARVLTLRPGQAGTVKATVSTIETVGWALPLLAGAIADAVDVTAGLVTYAVIAWGFALVAAMFARASRSRAQLAAQSA